MSNSEEELRVELAEHYKRLEAKGLTELASGNVSCRIDDDMLISPSGATADSITAENVVRVSFSGDTQSAGKPSSEWRMHAAVYERTDAKAVIHTHSDACVALSCQGQELPGFHYLVGEFGGSNVPCVPYSTFGTEQLAKDASTALTERTACLLGSHGMICRGTDLTNALYLAQRLEIMCRQYLLACQLGDPYLLSKEEWEDFFRQFNEMKYGVQS